MPMESVLFVGFVVAALAEFAAVLTYAEWATRHATDDTRTQIKRQHEEEAFPVRKAA